MGWKTLVRKKIITIIKSDPEGGGGGVGELHPALAKCPPKWIPLPKAAADHYRITTRIISPLKHSMTYLPLVAVRYIRPTTRASRPQPIPPTTDELTRTQYMENANTIVVDKSSPQEEVCSWYAFWLTKWITGTAKSSISIPSWEEKETYKKRYRLTANSEHYKKLWKRKRAQSH